MGVMEAAAEVKALPAWVLLFAQSPSLGYIVLLYQWQPIGV